MKNYRSLLIIGTTEILLGGTTLLGTLVSLGLGFNEKPANVLAFVISAALLSTLIGIGILRFKKVAYQLLLYFSSVVVLSKILMLMDVLRLSGAMETMVPMPVKNSVSILYHGFVIYYLQKQDIRQIFHH